MTTSSTEQELQSGTVAMLEEHFVMVALFLF